MIIPITDDWRLRSDRTQWIVEQRMVPGKNAKQQEPYWVGEAFYSTVETAAVGLFQLRLRLSDAEGTRGHRSREIAVTGARNRPEPLCEAGSVTALLKQPAIRSPALMKWARGHEAGCQVRLPGCQWEPTVGSHIPSGVRFGKGWATKPPDLPALACDYCHGVCDGRIKTEMEPEFIQIAWHDGFFATLIIAIDEGMIEVVR